MPQNKSLPIDDLILDLENYRTPKQKSEAAALKAMVKVDPDPFWGLTRSLLSNKVLPTENIIVLVKNGQNIVKEGNRRVAALKLILGKLKATDLEMPDDVKQQIAGLTDDSKAPLEKIPCAVFAANESETVDQIVTMTHGKSQDAARRPWNAVARARHNRDHLKQPELGLDLLDAYLKKGQNVSDDERVRWGGDFPVSVLSEALPEIAKRIKLAKPPDVITTYQKGMAASHVKALELLIHMVGSGLEGFPALRSKERDLLHECGFPARTPEPQAAAAAASSKTNQASSTASTSSSAAATTGKGTSSSKSTGSGKAKAEDLNDPKSVRKKFKAFAINGKNREKVVRLREEAIYLDIEKTPLAFCFVLRSMFELSAKAYCKDHPAGPKTEKNGQDRQLADVLRDIVKHLVDSAPQAEQKQVKKLLHGAMTDLAHANRLLSVTSMNQLIHNPSFSITGSDICVMSHNVFPLLEAMNA
ncbi:MAG: hypothetical protein ACREJD_02975 [Phycisphaerales bacterium]